MHFARLYSVDHHRSVRVAVCCTLVRDGPEEFSIGQGWGTMECNVAVLGAWDPKHCIVPGPFAQGAPLKGTTERQVPLRGEHGRESYRCQGTSDRLASCLATLSVAKPVGRRSGALRGSRADTTSTPMGSDPASSPKVPLVHEAVLCHGRSWRGGRLGVAVTVRGLSQPDLRHASVTVHTIASSSPACVCGQRLLFLRPLRP